MQDPTDQELMRRHRRGDARAFPVLLARHERRLWNYLRRLTGDREAAGDLLQEVFLKLLRRERSLRDRVSIEGWLFRVARNLALKHLRGEERRRRLTGPGPSGEGSSRGEVDAFGSSEPESAAERSWFRERVEREVGRLPGGEREVFLLRHHSGLAFREIASVLDIPLNTALVRMHRALNRLRGTLGPIYTVLERER